MQRKKEEEERNPRRVSFLERERQRDRETECVNGQRKELWREEESAENAGMKSPIQTEEFGYLIGNLSLIFFFFFLLFFVFVFVFIIN